MPKKIIKEKKVLSFQDIIMNLQKFWGKYGCVILQPYDIEVGAGTFHPATTLRSSRTKTLEGGLCSAIKKTHGWTIWRKSKQITTLLPVSSHHQTVSKRY